MRKGLLQNLRVERTDGVDAPATGRTWVIRKSEDGDPARAALDALVKAGVDLDAETADALNALAESAGVEVTFEAAEPEAPEGEPAAKAEGEPEELSDDDRPVTRGEFKDVLKDALAEVIADEKAGKAGGKPLSKQAKGTDKLERTEIKKGEGLFENVIFGQD